VFNSKKVSQERVMGISFVDILIQAVFLLLLILMVGYVDPVEQVKFEFSEAGKDLCNKLNKDSPQACVEFIQDKNVNVSKPGPKPVDPAEDFCKKRKLSPEDCKSTLDKMADNVNLWPCIPPTSTSQLTRSIYWIARAPGEIEFSRFSNEYIKYLKENDFSDKLKKVDAINASGKKIYSPSEVISTFGFIKEELCFHEYGISRPGKFSDADLSRDFEAIRSLRGK
jgi:hypothetical protein